ncbi:MAG TPA: hypothetical protein VGZ01_09595 [Trinickia sp.]|jgi:hypothetical protein|nr:hypothetical protein [Trinickia sp.]
MKLHVAIALTMALLTSATIATNASAQETTRAAVPAVNPIFEQPVARQQHDASGTGADMTASISADHRADARDAIAAKTGPAPSDCVGPISFCTPYFGN